MMLDTDEGFMDDDTAAASTSPLVERVIVHKLHGRSDFDLDLRLSEYNDRLTLFYGDNGCGKTTMLKLIWNLLSPASLKGHRTQIAEIAFSEFTVHMSGEIQITAKRPVPTAGPFEIIVRKKSRIYSRSKWPEILPFENYFDDWPLKGFPRRLAGLSEEVRDAGGEALEKKKYLELLKSFGSAPYFLADDRSTSSDDLDKSRPQGIYGRSRAQRDADSHDGPRRISLAEELRDSINQVNAKFRRLALGGSVIGSAGANSVYVEVIRHLASSAPLEKDAATTRKVLIDRVLEMGQRSKAFERLELIPRFGSVHYVDAIKSVSEDSLAVLQSVLDPFLQSHSARLDALEESRKLIQTLLDEANLFLTDKKLVFERREIRIELLDKSKLSVKQLSSGECHILLLLFNAVIARDKARLFLIDEPELSLNVKWQRRVVKSLLSVTEGSGLQFLMATHSIELLSSFRSRVVQLRPSEAQ